MSNNQYNPVHWKKKIPSYIKEEWSSRPSKFVQLFAEKIKPGSKVIELGAGAAQDSLWLERQAFDVVITDGDSVAFDEITRRSINKTKPQIVDVTKPLPFSDGEFDAVYAQLVLHYFNDETMRQIIGEIKRILKPGGLLACMVNSADDPEYDETFEDGEGLINVNGLIKRYFTVETFAPFINDFEMVLFDNKGSHPKDDAKGVNGMIRFIGRLK
jgi:ubiquinone/menaquinone biosynthesis C-methylase UbiE